jgi:site-specific DNA recombinase
MKRIDAGEVDGIIAWHPDRLSRNEVDGSAITYRLRKGTLKELVFVEYTFINSPEGIMMLQFAFSQSQYQVSKLSVDVTRGLEDKIALGWTPHRAPMGYLNDTHLHKGQCSISPDPERFALLQQGWKLLLTGSYSVEDIRKLLNDSWGMRTPISFNGHGGKPIAKSTIHNMVNNIFYAGLFVHAGKIYQGAHKPMVTPEEFRRVQELIKREKTERLKKGEKGDATLPTAIPLRIGTRDLPFTGMIRCAKCGSQVTASIKTKPSGKTYTYYHCSNSRGICPRSGIREETIMMQLESLLDKVTLDDDFYQWAIEDIEQEFHTIRETQDAQQAQRRRATEEIEKQKDALIGLLTRDLIDEAEYRERRTRLLEDKANLQKEIQWGDEGAEKVRDTCLNVVEFAKNARAWLLVGDVDTKRTIAKQLVSNWLLDGKNLIPELNPLLSTIAEQYPVLLAEKARIELNETWSESTKKEGITLLRSKWSGTWDFNRTLVTEKMLTFSALGNHIVALSSSGTL